MGCDYGGREGREAHVHIGKRVGWEREGRRKGERCGRGGGKGERGESRGKKEKQDR